MKTWEENQLKIENQMTALIASKFTHRKRHMSSGDIQFIHIQKYFVYIYNILHVYIYRISQSSKYSFRLYKVLAAYYDLFPISVLGLEFEVNTIVYNGFKTQHSLQCNICIKTHS